MKLMEQQKHEVLWVRAMGMKVGGGPAGDGGTGGTVPHAALRTVINVIPLAYIGTTTAVHRGSQIRAI